MGRAIHADIGRDVDDHGHVWFSGDDAAELLMRGYDLADLLFHPTPETDIYNRWCDRFDKTKYHIGSIPGDPIDASQTWWLDDAYRDLDVRATVLQRCQTDHQRDRVNMEMDLFEERSLIPLLRLMVMLVDHFRRNNVVWGVGRGSSVSSYVLFLLGVHRIDALKYDLKIDEFLR